MKASDLMAFLEYPHCKGDQKKTITGISSLAQAKEGNLVFCVKGNEGGLVNIKNCTVIISKIDVSAFSDKNTYIMVDNPRKIWADLIRKFFYSKEDRIVLSVPLGIHPTVIYPSYLSFLNKDIEIGPYSYIGREVVVGNSVRIGSYVHIEGRVLIGNNVSIQPQVTIGVMGMSYERNEAGKLENMPQIGGVVIADDVEIASKTNIHRGTLDNTIIGRGSKVSINCNIGHNSVIGKHTFIAGKTNLGGGTRVGDYCSIGMGVVTLPAVKIGNNVEVGMGSLVTKDIEDGVLAYGVPAKVIREVGIKYGE